MERIADDPEALARYSIADLVAAAGSEGVELIMWLVMRGALSKTVRCRHRNYYHPMVTGFGQLILEDLGDARPTRAATALAAV